MTMFQELYALAANVTLTLIVSADAASGQLTISVLPKPRNDAGEAALTKDLTLTARPEEFDDGFVQALRGYREAHVSLTQQAQATLAALEAAKQASAQKAAGAKAKPKPPKAVQPAQPLSEAVDADEDAADGGQCASETEALHPPAAGPARGESMSLFE